MQNNFSMRRTWGPTPHYERVLSYEPKQKEFIVIAGPCSVESVEQISLVASIAANEGATHLRGGVFRAGTYPGRNFGLVDEKLIFTFANEASKRGLTNIIEILDYRWLDQTGGPGALQKVIEYAGAVQVGCRQMQNYQLLRELGTFSKQVFLKRHPGATIDEWLGAAEHLLVNQTAQPVLIERGSSSHVNHVRWDLSVSMIPAVQSITKMPILIDGSHGTGRRDLVAPMTLAGVAAGANGCLIEVHPDPEKSISDADQAINPLEFRNLMKKVNSIRNILKE